MNIPRNVVGYLPVILAEVIFAWVYFSYITDFLWPLRLKSVAGTIAMFFLFHAVFIITQACFIKTIITDPGSIPDGFPEDYITMPVNNLPDMLLEGGIVPSIFSEVSKKGEPRKCSKCDKKKPDRSHHCSVCRRCVLKMDHHCPWVNNCVGFYNYKFFVLFLTWIVVLAVVVGASLLPSVIGLFVAGTPGGAISAVATFIVSVVFGLGLAMFAGTHYLYTMRNLSTIEVMEKRSRKNSNPFDFGASSNFQQVFGSNKLLWFLPVFTSVGNGLWFPAKYCENDQSDTLLGEEEQQSPPVESWIAAPSDT